MDVDVVAEGKKSDESGSSKNADNIDIDTSDQVSVIMESF